MVNNMIVSRYEGELPLGEGASRRIPGGPLYAAEEVVAVLESIGSSAVRSWTQKCSRDVQKLCLDAGDLYELIELAINNGRFRGAEWCVQRPGGPWAACDAYVVTRRERMPNANVEMDIEYYIKFAIGRSGAVLLIVSCHIPEERR